jgi:hypothetical protein
MIGQQPERQFASVGRLVLSLLAERQELIDESCVVVSSVVSQALRARGYPAIVVEGDLDIGAQSWLQHRLVVVELPDEWIIVDLAVRQVPAFHDDEILWVVIPPDPTTLRTILATRYAWWISP